MKYKVLFNCYFIIVLCTIFIGLQPASAKTHKSTVKPYIKSVYDQLIDAVKVGEIIKVQTLLATGIDAKALGTSLIVASENGHTNVVQILLAAGANVNAKAKNGDTALIKAAFFDRTPVADVLLEAKADVNSKDENGFTALMYAALNRHASTVKTLINAKADVNAKSNDGQTALMIALIPATTGQKALTYTADVPKIFPAQSYLPWIDNTINKNDDNTIKNDKATNLDIFETKENATVVDLLVAANSDVNARDNDGRTALILAAKEGRVSAVDKLLAAKSDVNSKGKDNLTALMWAANEGHADVVQLLLSAGADISDDVDVLITIGAALISDNADWINRNHAQKIFTLIKRRDNPTVIDGLVRKVTQDSENRLHVLFLAIKLGIPGSQERLNQALYSIGDKKMAEDFLNSGSSELHQGGESWAKQHGYNINSGEGSHRASWGRF